MLSGPAVFLMAGTALTRNSRGVSLFSMLVSLDWSGDSVRCQQRTGKSFGISGSSPGLKPMSGCSSLNLMMSARDLTGENASLLEVFVKLRAELGI